MHITPTHRTIFGLRSCKAGPTIRRSVIADELQLLTQPNKRGVREANRENPLDEVDTLRTCAAMPKETAR